MDKAELYEKYAEEAMKEKRYNDTIGNLDECARVKNANFSIYSTRAQTYFCLQKYKEAKKDCRNALNFQKNETKMLETLAMCYLMLGFIQKAYECLDIIEMIHGYCLERKSLYQTFKKFKIDLRAFEEMKEQKDYLKAEFFIGLIENYASGSKIIKIKQIELKMHAGDIDAVKALFISIQN